MVCTFRVGDSGEVASRTVNVAKGWLWVRYAGKRYDLFGGIHTDHWINPERPISRRKVREVAAA